MINKLEVRTAKGALLSLPFEDYSNGYAVADVQGLGPVKATIVKSSFAQIDGTQFHSSSLEDRNILLKLRLMPDWATSDVEDLRLELYDYLLPESPINLRFYNNKGLEVEIEGRVETLDPDIFAKDPTMDASIICFSPDFLALAPTTVSGSTVEDTTATTVAYSGTSDTGIVLMLNVDRTLTEFTIYNVTPTGSVESIDVETSFAAGDIVTVNTNVGSRGITLVRAGVTSQPLQAIQFPTSWITLTKGDNDIRVHAVGAAIPYSLEYTTRYRGL